jgi:hypothetical protein
MTTTNSIPCIRHGHASTCDARLQSVLAKAQASGQTYIVALLEALTDYDGQLWATWRTPEGRDAASAMLSRAWDDLGGERGALHLVRTNDGYDYQSDCMNDASS